jgi:hypothetical protein
MSTPTAPSFPGLPTALYMGTHFFGYAEEVSSEHVYSTTASTLKVFNPVELAPMSTVLPWHSVAEWASPLANPLPVAVPADQHLTAHIIFGPGIVNRRVTLRWAWVPSSWVSDITTLLKMAQLPSYGEVTVGAKETIMQVPPIAAPCPFSSLMPPLIKGAYEPSNRPRFIIYARAVEIGTGGAGHWFTVHMKGAYAVYGGILS